MEAGLCHLHQRVKKQKLTGSNYSEKEEVVTQMG